MIALYKKFLHSLRWNTAEALIYQSVLLSHQLLLFKVTDFAMYGLIGTLFASLYCLLTFTNGGFDAALSPFFTQYVKCKSTFYKFFFESLVLQILIFVAVALCAIMIVYKLNTLPLLLLFILALIFISEGIKKNLRAFLQLAFLTKQTALTEIITIIIYTGLVWGYHALSGQITLYIVFVPMLIISLMDIGILAWCTYGFYQSLPNSHEPPPQLTIKIIHGRFFNWLNQVSHTLFSSNFLVPLIALQFGLQHAGVFKLVGNITIFITTTLQKTFGFASNAFLANSKETSMQLRQEVFTRITQRLNLLLYGCIIFLTINYSQIVAFKGIAHTNINWAVVYLFMLLQISENFFIAHEKLFITQEKIDRLWWIYASIIGIVWLLAQQHYFHFSPLILLLIMLLLRLISFMWITAATKAWWHLHTDFSISPVALIGWIALSMVFRLIMAFA